jgi:hypothetical protein
MNIIQTFRSLPTQTKKLLGLGMALALTLALPLFVWGVTTQNYNVSERAASGEPTFTPIPSIGNRVPVIRTSQLPFGYLAKGYSAVIEGYDKDIYDNLTLKVSNLPPGLSVSLPCKSVVASNLRIVTCTISGNPTQTGTFKMSVTLTDGVNTLISKTINAPIRVVWDLNAAGKYAAPTGITATEVSAD